MRGACGSRDGGAESQRAECGSGGRTRAAGQRALHCSTPEGEKPGTLLRRARTCRETKTEAGRSYRVAAAHLGLDRPFPASRVNAFGAVGRMSVRSVVGTVPNARADSHARRRGATAAHDAALSAVRQTGAQGGPHARTREGIIYVSRFSNKGSHAKNSCKRSPAGHELEGASIENVLGTHQMHFSHRQG